MMATVSSTMTQKPGACPRPPMWPWAYNLHSWHDDQTFRTVYSYVGWPGVSYSVDHHTMVNLSTETLTEIINSRLQHELKRQCALFGDGTIIPPARSTVRLEGKLWTVSAAGALVLDDDTEWKPKADWQAGALVAMRTDSSTVIGAVSGVSVLPDEVMVRVETSSAQWTAPTDIPAAELVLADPGMSRIPMWYQVTPHSIVKEDGSPCECGRVHGRLR